MRGRAPAGLWEEMHRWMLSRRLPVRRAAAWTLRRPGLTRAGVRALSAVPHAAASLFSQNLYPTTFSYAWKTRRALTLSCHLSPVTFELKAVGIQAGQE